MPIKIKPTSVIKARLGSNPNLAFITLVGLILIGIIYHQYGYVGGK